MTCRGTNTQQGISESPLGLNKQFSRNTKLSEPTKGSHKKYMNEPAMFHGISTDPGDSLTKTSPQVISYNKDHLFKIHKRNDAAPKVKKLNENPIDEISSSKLLEIIDEKEAIIYEMKKEKQLLEIELERFKRMKSGNPKKTNLEKQISKTTDRRHYKRNLGPTSLDVKDIKNKILSFYNENNNKKNKGERFPIFYNTVTEPKETTDEKNAMNIKLCDTLNLLDKAKSNIMGLQKNLDNLKERNSRRHKGPFTKELSILKDNIKKLVRIVEKSNIPQT